MNVAFRILIAMLSFAFAASAQTAEISVNGVKLGDRDSAKALLADSAPTTDDKGRPAYFFYNDFGDKVWRLTVGSFEDRFNVVEMEVYQTGKNYDKPHFYLRKVDTFKTESNIFVGKRVSAAAAILGEGLATDTRIGPKDIVRKLGDPTSRTTDGDREILVYEIKSLEIIDEKGGKLKRDYQATYVFVKKKLWRFTLSIAAGN